MKLLTREEKRDPRLLSLYNDHVKAGMKPQRAADRAREEARAGQEPAPRP